jgi:hypothetical protein
MNSPARCGRIVGEVVGVFSPSRVRFLLPSLHLASSFRSVSPPFITTDQFFTSLAPVPKFSSPRTHSRCFLIVPSIFPSSYPCSRFFVVVLVLGFMFSRSRRLQYTKTQPLCETTRSCHRPCKAVRIHPSCKMLASAFSFLRVCVCPLPSGSMVNAGGSVH